MIFAALILGWLGVLTTFAQEKTEKDPFVAEASEGAPKNIRVQLEYIDVSQKDLTRLMMEDKSTTTDAKALRMKVQELVDKGEAKFIDTQLITAIAQRQAMSSSFNEYVYPIEYDPPGGINPESSQKADEHPFIMALPTSFETRNVGSNLEIEATLTDDSRLLDVRVSSTFLWHSGDNIWHESKDSKGNVYKTTTPNFYKIGIETSAMVVTGQYFLAGVVSPKDAKGQVDTERKVMAFLKCDALSVVP